MNRTISAICEALCYTTCIALIRFKMFTNRHLHSRRSQDDALDADIIELVVQIVSQAPGFISAGNVKRIIFELLLQISNDFDDVKVVRFNLDLISVILFSFELWFSNAKGVICAMDIHPDFEYSVHGDLLCMR